MEDAGLMQWEAETRNLPSTASKGDRSGPCPRLSWGHADGVSSSLGLHAEDYTGLQLTKLVKLGAKERQKLTVKG